MFQTSATTIEITVNTDEKERNHATTQVNPMDFPTVYPVQPAIDEW
jgi:hypothetical protein